MMAEDMAEKKLRGSGGFAIARITEEEQKKGNLGGPELFLAGIGRLEEDRFEKYYCNKCEKEYEGAPAVIYENPNEELGEGVMLAEKGEYKCKTCNSTIAQYRKFETQAQQVAAQMAPTAPTPVIDSGAQQLAAPSAPTPAAGQSSANPEQWVPISVESTPASISSGFVSIQSLMGMAAYDSEAMHLGKVEDAGLRKTPDGLKITFKVAGREVTWDRISKIGDIILLKSTTIEDVRGRPQNAEGRCPSCGYANEAGAAFCAECGSRL